MLEKAAKIETRKTENREKKKSPEKVTKLLPQAIEIPQKNTMPESSRKLEGKETKSLKNVMTSCLNKQKL